MYLRRFDIFLHSKHMKLAKLFCNQYDVKLHEAVVEKNGKLVFSGVVEGASGLEGVRVEGLCDKSLAGHFHCSKCGKISEACAHATAVLLKVVDKEDPRSTSLSVSASVDLKKVSDTTFLTCALFVNDAVVTRTTLREINGYDPRLARILLDAMLLINCDLRNCADGTYQVALGNEISRCAHFFEETIPALEREGIGVVKSPDVSALRVISNPDIELSVESAADTYLLKLSSSALTNEQLASYLWAYKREGSGEAMFSRGLVCDWQAETMDAVQALADAINEPHIQELARGVRLVPAMAFALRRVAERSGKDEYLGFDLRSFADSAIEAIEAGEFLLPVPQSLCAEYRLDGKDALHPYQKDDFAFLQTRYHAGPFGVILSHEMGMGKTRIALSHVLALKEAGCSEFDHLCLVVAPKSVVHEWRREADAHLPALKVVVVDGPPKKREEILNAASDADVVVVSLSLLESLEHLLARKTFELMVLDEAHEIRNSRAKRFEAVCRVASRCRVKQRVAITGTPIVNGVSDLWSLMQYANPSVLGSLKSFVKSTNEHDPLAQADVGRILSPFMVVRTHEEATYKLPKLDVRDEVIEITGAQKAVNEAIKKDLIEYLFSLNGEEDVARNYIHILAKFTLWRMASLDARLIKGVPESVGVGAKLVRAVEICKAAKEKGEKVAVFCSLPVVYPLLKQELDHLGIVSAIFDGQTSSARRKELIEKMNDPESDLDVLLMGLKSGGLGINIATCCKVCIELDSWWTPASHQQGRARIWRQGNTSEVVTCYRLLAQNTIEDRMIEIQERKRQLTSGVLESSKRNRLTLSELKDLVGI